ncbi:hypothetical protein EDB85DRAFT_2295073, partial [Lactarius pseudohatsudake]
MTMVTSTAMVPCRTHPDNDDDTGCDGEHSATNSSDGVGTTHLVPVVDKMRDGFMDGFAGLYVDSLLARPFVRTGGRAYLLTRTSQRSRLEIILVDLEQPESVVRLTPAESGDDLWSWSPLATD